MMLQQADRTTMVIPRCRACNKAMPVAVPEGTMVYVCCPKCKARGMVVA